MAHDPFAGAAREHGLGLRAQILFALGIGFALSVILLGIATSRLGSRALDVDRTRSARTIASTLLSAGELDDARLGDTIEGAIAEGGIAGARVTIGAREIERGRRAGVPVEVRRGSASARVWIADDERARSLPGLLFLYVGVTAAAILLLTYVLLTRAIVRPVEDLTRASERLAKGGREEVRAPVRGAAEVVRLAIAFNEMQGHLARERTALEDRLRELERTTFELASAQQSLVRSEKMASVGRLAAGVAHEIGNPLSAILGLVELVREGELPPEQAREFLARVTKETERIHRIIGDLLDFARVEPAGVGSCDLAAVVEDAVRLIVPQKDLRHVTIERRIAEDCPPVRGDAARLEQVVLNLLLNAADAIGGDGTIRVEITKLGADQVELVVVDSGPGIAPAVRDSLFEPFVTTKPAGSGTGLGLAVCHTIIEDLGGRIDAGDDPEGGARFSVRLPVAPQ